jgi:hypothetical protein
MENYRISEPEKKSEFEVESENYTYPLFWHEINCDNNLQPKQLNQSSF